MPEQPEETIPLDDTIVVASPKAPLTEGHTSSTIKCPTPTTRNRDTGFYFCTPPAEYEHRPDTLARHTSTLINNRGYNRPDRRT